MKVRAGSGLEEEEDNGKKGLLRGRAGMGEAKRLATGKDGDGCSTKQKRTYPEAFVASRPIYLELALGMSSLWRLEFESELYGPAPTPTSKFGSIVDSGRIQHHLDSTPQR